LSLAFSNFLHPSKSIFSLYLQAFLVSRTFLPYPDLAFDCGTFCGTGAVYATSKNRLSHPQQSMSHLGCQAGLDAILQRAAAAQVAAVPSKMTNGFRSEWGAKGYAALQSVLATAQMQGKQLLATLVSLVKTPILHYLPASDR
jgi:hypothetical protein